ncbi:MULTISPECIES: hypothetical protein [Actinomadura]|uniref:Uncharacterized protein n=1 Tax=Actinomadura miaoliensis TaxID=430685 RepID=A0ABP7VJG1_9ACTN
MRKTSLRSGLTLALAGAGMAAAVSVATPASAALPRNCEWEALTTTQFSWGTGHGWLNSGDRVYGADTSSTLRQVYAYKFARTGTVDITNFKTIYCE